MAVVEKAETSSKTELTVGNIMMILNFNGDITNSSNNNTNNSSFSRHQAGPEQQQINDNHSYSDDL